MTQYIDKSALVAEIEERRDSLISLSESCPANTAAKSGFYAQAQTLEGIKNFINTLEVKEVDIEKEIKDYFDNQPIIARSKGVDYQLIPSREDIAKHFFELGLKAQKG